MQIVTVHDQLLPSLHVISISKFMSTVSIASAAIIRFDHNKVRTHGFRCKFMTMKISTHEMDAFNKPKF